MEILTSFVQVPYIILLLVLIAFCLMFCLQLTAYKGIKKIKKEHEGQLAKERIEWEGERCELKEENQNQRHERHRIRYEFQIALEELEDELKKEKKSNASKQGWNTKYRKTIEKKDEKIEELKEMLKYCWIKIDESKIVTEYLITTAKKSEKQNAVKAVNNYLEM